MNAELEVSPEEAFRLLSRYSQNTDQRVRKISRVPAAKIPHFRSAVVSPRATPSGDIRLSIIDLEQHERGVGAAPGMSSE
jgi:hypothetical protein